MDLEEYRKDLIEEVKAAATESRNFASSTFVEITSGLLADAGELADFELCQFKGTGSKKRSLALDGYAFDEADDSVRVLVGDWDGLEASPTITQTEAKALLGRARAFVEESLTGKFYENLENSSGGYAFSKELFNRRAELTRCRIYLATDKILSGRAKDFPEGKIGSIPVEFHVWDISRFHRVSESSSGRDDIEIDFGLRIHGGVPCIAASVESDDYKAYLCVIRGDVLASIYDEFGSRLLEGNVRSFLSAKGKINKGIRGTIRSEPHMFFAYNNGIAATAAEAEIKAGARGQQLMRVKELQIVNGGQTTASLAAALREGGAALDTIFVQMKLSVIPSERAGAVIPLIARYANSQNKVSDADFFSNHDFHRRLETLSRQIWAPAVSGAQHETHWFYERARGQFVNEQARMTKSEKKRFLLQNPKNQIISKTDVAKLQNTWALRPHIVCLGAQKNFINFAVEVEAEWEYSDSGFNREYFTGIVAKKIIFAEAERLVAAQAWYQGGYRAQIVAYTIAKLVNMIATNEPRLAIDLGSTWLKQSVGEGLETALAVVASKIHEVLINPDSGHANVTEWSKREQCWRRIASLQIPIGVALRRELVDKEIVREVKKEARKGQKEDTKIDKVFEVVNLGGLFWSGLRDWGSARRIWSDEEASLLALACRKNFVPLDRQALKLMGLREKAASEGFVKV
jgi:hypothetical protein